MPVMETPGDGRWGSLFSLDPFLVSSASSGPTGPGSLASLRKPARAWVLPSPGQGKNWAGPSSHPQSGLGHEHWSSDLGQTGYISAS